MANNVFLSNSANPDWTSAGNWSLGAAPVSTNDVFITNSSSTISTGLAQSAVTLASLNIDDSYTGSLGTTTAYLAIGATVFNIGRPSIAGGSGSPRININAANASATVNVSASAQSATDRQYTPIKLLGTTIALNCSGGSTGVAIGIGETSSVTTLNMVSGVSNPNVVLGAGNTLTTANVISGTLTNYSANATTTVYVAAGGKLVHLGSAGYTTLTIDSRNTCTYTGTGTITTLNLTGTIDFSQGTGAVVITNCNAYNGATLIDPKGRVTFTNNFQTINCRMSDVTFNLGYNRTYNVT